MQLAGAEQNLIGHRRIDHIGQVYDHERPRPQCLPGIRSSTSPTTTARSPALHIRERDVRRVRFVADRIVEATGKLLAIVGSQHAIHNYSDQRSSQIWRREQIQQGLTAIRAGRQIITRRRVQRLNLRKSGYAIGGAASGT